MHVVHGPSFVFRPHRQPFLDTSPFHCTLYDGLNRPWTKEGARPTTLEGRSWHADMPLPLAKKMIIEAAQDQSVSKEMLMAALHMVEYDAAFEAGANGGWEVGDLEGEWRLAFNGDAPFLESRRDRWGYLIQAQEKEGEAEEEVAVMGLRIDTRASTIVLDSLQEPLPKSFQGTFWKDRGEKVHVDVTRVQLLKAMDPANEEEEAVVEVGGGRLLPESELPLMDAFLRPGSFFEVIQVDKLHLALRYHLGGALESSLLIFNKVAPFSAEGGESPEGGESVQWREVGSTEAGTGIEDKSAPEAEAEGPHGKDRWGHVKKANREGQPRYANAEERLQQLRQQRRMLGGYDSFWEYLEEEKVSLFLVLAFPAFVKASPHLLAAAHVKWMLLQEMAGSALQTWGGQS